MPNRPSPLPPFQASPVTTGQKIVNCQTRARNGERDFSAAGCVPCVAPPDIGPGPPNREAAMKDCLEACCHASRPVRERAAPGSVRRCGRRVGSRAPRPMPRPCSAAPFRTPASGAGNWAQGTATGSTSATTPVARGARAGVIHGLLAAGGKVIDTAPPMDGGGVLGDLLAEAASAAAFFWRPARIVHRATGPEQLQASVAAAAHRQGPILMQLHNVSDPPPGRGDAAPTGRRKAGPYTA